MPEARWWSRVEAAVEIDAAASTVFEFVAADWETDLGFADGRVLGGSPRPPTRLRPEFRVRFDGELLALRGPVEVTVRGRVERGGWAALSASGPEPVRRWRFERSGLGCRVAQTCEWLPRGWAGRLRERCGGRNRRAERVEASLQRLKLLVERQRSLDRLRARRRSGET